MTAIIITAILVVIAAVVAWAIGGTYREPRPPISGGIRRDDDR